MGNKYKRWVWCVVALLMAGLVLLGGFTAFIDPYFHYHGPLPFVKYELKNERYQNNGIVRHFDYDAIITGSSMTECFRTSQLDELFGVKSVKVPFSGGSFREVNENLQVAVDHNPELKMVVRCLDANRFFDHKDKMDYDDYPDYLYDESLWNDASYLFNKDILMTAVQNLHGYMASGNNAMSMDEYVNWSNFYTYGREAILGAFAPEEVERTEYRTEITQEEYRMMDESISRNITELIAAHPEIEFYIYISPYSIYCMDYWRRSGTLERQLLAEKYYIEKLLPYDNVKLFSFFTDYDTVCNPDNYKDVAHHGGWVNSRILEYMKSDTYRLTIDNYEAYCQEVWDYYLYFDYGSLYE